MEDLVSGLVFVAGAFDVVVGGEDVGLLGGEELMDGQREVLFEGVLVGSFGDIFSLLGGFEQGVIAADDPSFQIAPDSMDGTDRGAGFLDIVIALTAQLFFELGAEVSALEGLAEEEALKGVVWEVLANIREAFLAVVQGGDERTKDAFGLVQLGGVSGHAGLVPFGVVLDRQGPPAGSDSPSPAASRRNRENPAPLPANF